MILYSVPGRIKERAVKKILTIAVCVLLAGCAAIEVQEQAPAAVETSLSRRFVTLRQIAPGMTRPEINSLLGSEIVIGYELVNPANGQYKPITVKNPYRSETVKKGPKEFVVDYYLVGIKEPDDQVTDDELVPLVFQRDKFMGSGWDYLNQKIKSP